MGLEIKLQTFISLSLTSSWSCLCVALDVAFGSLYRDDVLIRPTNVVPVLAAATLLSLV